MPAYYDQKQKTWYCKFYYTDYTGTRKQKLKRGFQLQREAKEWERQFLERQQGAPDMSFQSLYSLYLNDMGRRLRASTLEVKENMIKNHILPYFGNKPVNNITPADIRQWQNIMMDKGYSDYYLNRIQVSFSTILNYAVKYFNLPFNPCSRAGCMGCVTRSLNFWTLEQYQKVLQCVTDIRAYTALQVLFYSGIRCGEMRALTLSDFNFEECTISISKTLHHTSNGYQIAPPKTDNGKRVVTVPAAVMDEVKEYCNKIYGLMPADRVFTFSAQLIKRAMVTASAQADIPVIRIHDLRHSHVSLLIDMGFSPHLIAERIGDTVQMINTTYGHLYSTRHKEVADQLNKLIVSN